MILFASHPRLGTLAFDSEGERGESAISHAVRLSSSIPGLFIPEEYDGERVYDGGLLNNFPVDIYQRVCRRDTSEEVNRTKCEDFIALYIGSREQEETESHEEIDQNEIQLGDSQLKNYEKSNQYKSNKKSLLFSSFLNIQSWWPIGPRKAPCVKLMTPELFCIGRIIRGCFPYLSPNRRNVTAVNLFSLLFLLQMAFSIFCMFSSFSGFTLFGMAFGFSYFFKSSLIVFCFRILCSYLL